MPRLIRAGLPLNLTTLLIAIFRLSRGHLSTLSRHIEHIEIVGEHAFIRSEELTRVVHSPGLAQEVTIHDYTYLPRAEQWGYREEDRLFIGACLGQTPPAVSVEEAYKSIELGEACYQSAANGGEKVNLPL